jgi:hypothetical protein
MPTTGKNVQAWFDDDTPADDSLPYVSLRCPACAQMHLVNRVGGTVDEKPMTDIPPPPSKLPF